jgi:hypothetical protein
VITHRNPSMLIILSLSLAASVAIGIYPVIAQAPSFQRLNAAAALAALANGDYQVCSQPPPQDGRDGAGVCLRFTKVAAQITGYYGYPQSDNFICFRGQVRGDRLTGEALALSWPGAPWSHVSPLPLHWDQERHLTLAQGTIIQHPNRLDERLTWIHFQTATLELSNFYQYPTPRMRAATDLCDWPVVKP